MAKEDTQTVNYTQLVIAKIKQHYQSIILGLLVVAIAISIIMRLANQYRNNTSANNTSETSTEAEQNNLGEKTYTVQKGDTLWSIAEANYGSGYNSVDIIEKNRLTDPDGIETGQVLILPSVEPKKPTAGETAKVQTGEVSIQGTTYTVQKGDKLWDIAVRAYGDGYTWSKIAKENKLANPDDIETGMVLTLPR